MNSIAKTDGQPCRCAWLGKWATTEDSLYRCYHDEEWGVPVRDSRHLFEMLTLEAAQAGLSWITVLRKRENYRAAFHDYDIKRIATYDERDLARLLANPGLIRNRLKLSATISNAQAWLAYENKTGSCAELLWSFVNGQALQPNRTDIGTIPAQTSESLAMSKALKKLGFRFVGSTICYAFMQAAGMVNDHTLDCFRHPQLLRCSSSR